MAEHLTIGDVLALLQVDFPDVTISKIRFLESQGLIDPERTPSGYRKFSDDDIAVLEWILTQQRDHFLPLKVIRERIELGEHLAEIAGDRAGEDVPAPDPHGPASDSGSDRPVVGGTDDDGPGPRAGHGTGGPLSAEVSSLTMTAEELAAASGLSPLELEELETYGLLHSHHLGPTTYYDGEALLVARVAKEFSSYGVEPRHLRMFRTAAEREASVFEQATMPLLQQRRPAARAEAREALDRLAVLGERLRGAMMRVALGEHLD